MPGDSENPNEPEQESTDVKIPAMRPMKPSLAESDKLEDLLNEDGTIK